MSEPEIQIIKIKSSLMSDPRMIAALKREREMYARLTEDQRKLVNAHDEEFERRVLGIRDIPSDLMNPDGAF